MKNRQAILNVLNGLEIIDEQGGEGGWALVEVNEEMLENLEAVGVDRKTVIGYGDDGTTCIMAIGFGEGYADWWDGKKLTLDSKKEELFQENEQLLKELEAERIRADKAEQERDKLEQMIDEIDQACGTAEHSNFAEYVYDTLLKYDKSKIL